jgi:hypothetical protein
MKDKTTDQKTVEKLKPPENGEKNKIKAGLKKVRARRKKKKMEWQMD